MRRARFAPSPTGLLHLGHAFSALTAASRADPGEFLIRIEDIDKGRCRPEHEAAIFDDLAWLGLGWRLPVWRQSDRRDAYDSTLNTLISLGLCYPCRCTRGDIRAALTAPQEGVPAVGPDGIVYPGTCRCRTMAEAGPEDAIRLDMRRAVEHLGGVWQLAITDSGTEYPGTRHLDEDRLVNHVGDVVLSRRDFGTSYHLAVVVDDAAQGITEVVRGADLFEATQIHRLLQALLGLPVPVWHHHRLIRDETGKRLAKRDDARAIRRYREDGMTPAEVRALVGF